MEMSEVSEVTALPQGPFCCALEGGTYYWCACGLSQKQPFCDGSHKQDPDKRKSLSFVLDKTEDVFLCGCKQTRTPPFCDGSHQKLRLVGKSAT
jgi:CDGSH iron-sulfur domain-containing protein 3